MLLWTIFKWWGVRTSWKRLHPPSFRAMILKTAVCFSGGWSGINSPVLTEWPWMFVPSPCRCLTLGSWDCLMNKRSAPQALLSGQPKLRCQETRCLVRFKQSLWELAFFPWSFGYHFYFEWSLQYLRLRCTWLSLHGKDNLYYCLKEIKAQANDIQCHPFDNQKINPWRGNEQ